MLVFSGAALIKLNIHSFYCGSNFNFGAALAFHRVPTPVAVLISAAVFALAHLTPGEFPQLFVLGSDSIFYAIVKK